MRQKSLRQGSRWTAFLRLYGACWPPIEYPVFEVDITCSGDAFERRAADRAGACAGIEADQDKTRDVLPGAPPGRLSFLYFAVAPGAPDQLGSFVARQPSLPSGPFLG